MPACWSDETHRLKLRAPVPMAAVMIRSLAIALAAHSTTTVGADGRIATRVAYRGGRTIAFSAHGTAVRIAVRAAS
jgi:hypothetical protein